MQVAGFLFSCELFNVWVEVQQQHWSFMLLSYIFPWLPKTLHCLWMLCHSERIFCFWFFLKRSSRSWRVSGAIPHSGIASNRNFLLFFLPWILRSVLHSGMSYPLSAAFDYSLPNTAPLCLRPSSPCFLFCLHVSHGEIQNFTKMALNVNGSF